MARLLRNLIVREVSGVDRGAGEGVRVMLMKRDADAELSDAQRTFARKVAKIESEGAFSAAVRDEVLMKAMDEYDEAADEISKRRQVRDEDDEQEHEMSGSTPRSELDPGRRQGATTLRPDAQRAASLEPIGMNMQLLQQDRERRSRRQNVNFPAPPPETGPVAKKASAYEALLEKAAEIRRREPKLSEAMAFDKAYCDPANRVLVELSKGL